MVISRSNPVRRQRLVLSRFSTVDKAIVLAIALSLILQLHLQFVQKINWDEFYFLARIHDYQRGDLGHALQTFHVHLFGWLTSLGGSEVFQINLGRTVMWLCQLGTLAFIYSTSRVFMSRTGALMAALAFVSSGFVFIHGTSFRADPLAALLMMYCIWMLVRSPLAARDLVGGAVAAALAALVTIKVALFAPALAGLAVWRVINSPSRSRRALSLLAAALGALALFGLFYSLHQGALAGAPMEASRADLSSAWTTTLLSAGLFPRGQVLVAGFYGAIAQSFLFASGLYLAGAAIKRRGPNRTTAIMLLVLAAPLASFIFYRNAFPYFFAFIFPPAMGLVGYAFDQIKERQFLAGGLIVMMLAGVINQYAARVPQNQSAQKDLIEVVHTMFPRPVAYFDRCSMMSGYPGVGFFMSSWGVQKYRAAGAPVFQKVLADKVVPLLIVNSPLLKSAVIGASEASSQMSLLPRDRDALRSNFIHHWGDVWVAGKNLEAIRSGDVFTIQIPGDYTVEALGAVRIDGQLFQRQSVVHLGRGVHTISADQKTALTLRWGQDLYNPPHGASPWPLFTGF